jgi:hypothetical protein
VDVIAWAGTRGLEGIVHLGDFGIWPGRSGRLFLDAVQVALERAGVWLIFLDGNHEDFWQLDALTIGADGLRAVRPRIWHVPRGTRWRWAGRVFMAMGGAVSLDRKYRRLGRDWWPQETITLAQLNAAICAGPVDVLLTHDAPSAAVAVMPGLSPDSAWDGEELAKAKSHQRLLQTLVETVGPSRLLHGHMHVRYDRLLRFGATACIVSGLGGHEQSLGENIVVLDWETL